MTDVRVRYTGDHPQTLPTLFLEVEHGDVITVNKKTAASLPPTFALVEDEPEEEPTDPADEADEEPAPEPVIDPELAKAAQAPAKRTARRKP